MIATTTVTHLTIDDLKINFDLQDSKNFELEMQLEATVNPPKDSNDKTVLLMLKAEIRTTKNDAISINALSRIILEFDKKPEDYQKSIKELCLPLAQKELLKRIDIILDNMGYSELDVSSDNFEEI